MAEDAIRLNLGCGARLLKGFVNVDLADNWTKHKPEVSADVTGPLPFPDNYADEVHAYHLFEHIHRWKAQACLAEWVRVLKPGGLMVLEMPCLDKIVRIFAHSILEDHPVDIRLTLWGLYGDPKYENDAMTHKWCYGSGELAGVMEAAGLSDIRLEDPKTHQQIRDMRMTGVKNGNDLQHPQD